jgi:transposase InsO family protein
MMRYSFMITHVPGKELVIADALSRAPLPETTPADGTFEGETAAFINLVLDHLPASEQRLEEIKQLQCRDEVCQAITNFCQSGWPERKTLSPQLKPYFPLAAEFSVEEGLLLRGSRIVIPHPLRAEMLKRIHEGHQGITKCRERARSSVWWPGLSTDLKQLVEGCMECAKTQVQPAQPLTPSPLPELPWQRVATDLFQWKNATYLLVVDYYSRYIEIAKLDRTTAEEVVIRMKGMFARHGIPEVVVSDNGPQYSCEAFRLFAADYQFQHNTSSPYYPESNGEAERAVRTIKGLLKKSSDPYKALLAYRTTPTRTGYSPSELLMGRLLRSTVPVSKAQRQPRLIDPECLRERDERNKQRQKANFDSRRAARELPPLHPGDPVWLPDKGVTGTMQEAVAPQSFTVESPEGEYRRNRMDIIRLPDLPAAQNQPVPTTETIPSEDTGTPVRKSSRKPRPPDRLDPSWSH